MKPEDAALEAAKLVGGDRGDSYGDPGEDFARTAAILNAWVPQTGWLPFRPKFPEEAQQLRGNMRLYWTPKLVVKVLLAVKLSRESHAHKHDNLVDLCGYASILAYLEEPSAENAGISAVARERLDEELEREVCGRGGLEECSR